LRGEKEFVVEVSPVRPEKRRRGGRSKNSISQGENLRRRKV